ncbi:aminopeptidase [Acidaminobacter sp. JC074]|uniref:aminopeptidase n=1 Tax=Acidaminobacter sp. JC074 TaxID=2530199 RepID=UPI001F0D946A|nr:aminopeptidase [Acidaminobacter sp. JC074]
MLTKVKAVLSKADTSNEGKFISHLGNELIKWLELEKTLSEDFFKENDFETLRAHNKSLYLELLEENYKNSYANPDYAVSIFGPDKGKFITGLYTDFRNCIQKAYKHDTNGLGSYVSLYEEISDKLSSGSLDELVEIYRSFKLSRLHSEFTNQVKTQSDPVKSFATQVISSSDLTDLRYLFKFGLYITDNEIKTAEFLSTYDSDELKKLMVMTAKAYVKGFETDGKDVTLRNNVQIKYNVGQERMIQVLIEAFKDENLTGFYGGLISTPANKQYQYDHRFDDGIYLNETFAEKNIQTVSKVLEEQKDITYDYSGIMYFDKFGETPFSPASKSSSIQYSDVQNKLSQEMRNKNRSKSDEYYKGTETSFCIIAFPVPEIGQNFEEIYADTCKINQLSSEEYLPIQQHIIDALDKSDYVHIKGIQGNETDIKVMHKKLSSPEKESNYYNCGADVNIPVGEVFTSPVLKGTNGMLHLDVVFLDELKYVDLKLTFQDGYVKDYSCKNFASEEENKKYIEENLLFPHKTLPLGEFAIGTNTLAYVIAEKYDIVDILPILIVEKMGPHFAIGDTCYTYAEDIDVYNPDGKCIVARDNEKSILRKEDLSKAYTNVHTDITLPYDSIGHITGMTESGEKYEIIKNGRFVLAGTEKLNEPFN